MQTDPDIQNCILLHLRGWKDNTQVDGPPSLLIEELLKHQAALGWRRFFEGWISREWTKAQQAYYQSTKSLRTGRRWTIALIKKLGDIAWDLWEHRNGVLHESQNVVSETELRRLDRSGCSYNFKLCHCQPMISI